MLGTYRTLLALMVVVLHLGGVPMIGAFAVFGFYIISGYLMTFIMHRNYGYNIAGVVKYAINRFLRIYPLYWLSIAFSALLILYVGQDFAVHYHESMFLPEGKQQWLKNILLVFSYSDSPRLTPPAWALSVELFFYICIGFGLSKTKRLTHYWFVLSISYHVFIGVAGFDAAYRYFIIPAASLPFSTGALIFHYKDEIYRLSLRCHGVLYNYMPLILLLLVLLNWYAGFLVCEVQQGFFNKSGFFYVNYLLNALIVASLVNRKLLPYISRRIDKAMGDLSYPIYLFHYQAGLLVIILAGSLNFNLSRPSLSLFFISTPFIILLSWLVARSVELPVEKIRSRVKSAGASGKTVDQAIDVGVQDPQATFSPRADAGN